MPRARHAVVEIRATACAVLLALSAAISVQSAAPAFAQTLFTLSVSECTDDNFQPAGGAIVVNGQTHSLPWSGQFEAGQQLTLHALPPAGYAFSHWSGGLSGTQDPLTITITADLSVIVMLAGGPWTASANAMPAEGGVVVGVVYANGILWAEPAPGWRFTGWSGDLSGTANPIEFEVHGNMQIDGQFAPVGQTAVFYRQTFEDDTKVNWSKWHYTGDWAVIPDVTAKPGIPGDPSPYGSAALVYNKSGDYQPNVGASVTTTAIDCSQYTGVALTFLRSLTVEALPYDHAAVEVSNDGETWQTVYANPLRYRDPVTGKLQGVDLTNPAWYQVSFDISGVADRQKTVYVRFSLASNGTNDHDGQAVPLRDLHGWALDDITLSGAGPDPAYTFAPVGVVLPSGLASYGPLPALPGPLWEIASAAAGGGQTRDADGDPTTPGTETVGGDPDANAAGIESGTILGTVIGGNYPAGMSGPQYLQWGPLDLTGLQETALAFQRWLEVGAGRYDRASIQVHIATLHPAGDTVSAMAPEVIAESTPAVTLTQAKPSSPYPVSTGEHYAPLGVSFTYNTKGLAGDGSEVLRFQYTLDNTAAAPTWVTFAGGAVSTNTYDVAQVDEGALSVAFGAAAFASQTDYIRAQDDAAFAVRAVLSRSDGSGLDAASRASAAVSGVKVTGVLWSYVWDNKQASPTTEIFDKEWTPVSYDLSRFGADHCPSVWVRWSLGPTDTGFNTEYGGWSLDGLQIMAASSRWAADAITAPAALVWDQTSDITITARNAGTATWDSAYRLYEVQGEVTTVAPNPAQWEDIASASLIPIAMWNGSWDIRNVAADPDDPLSQPISRWGVGSVAVTGTVGPDAAATFTAKITAPPLSSVEDFDWGVGYDTSALDCDWALARPTAAGPVSFVWTMLNTTIAHTRIVTTRFADDAIAPDGTPFWARGYIEVLAGRVPAIVQGYGDGTYRPSVIVTRDQMAVYIARACGLTPTGIATQDFIDVPTDSWAYPQIEACYQAGIVSGYPDRSYQPAGQVTRDQMAKFVALAAGYNITPAPTTDDAPGWFTDVEVELPSSWKPGDPDPRNPFRDYINTLLAKQVVQGYIDTAPDGTWTRSYRPSQPVTRDQLAVYLFRAFVCSSHDPVVVGGPAVTSVRLTDGAAPYYGYANAGTPFLDGPFAGGVKPYQSAMVQSDDRVYAYITVDSYCLWQTDQSLHVTFQLVPVSSAATPAAAHDETIPAETLREWVPWVPQQYGDQPYRNVAWAIPTGLQGDYRLLVTIDGNALARQPAFSVRGPLYPAETFDAVDWLVTHRWDCFGQPAMPGPRIYPLSYSPDEVPFPQRWAERGVLYNGGGSLELTQTQSVVKGFSTAGRHNVRLGLRFAAPAASFGGADAITIQWSKDWGSLGSGGAHWTTIAKLTRSSIPTALQQERVFYALANGDPNADPRIIGADDNDNFAIRLSINGSATTKAYFDDVVLEGT